MSMVSLSELSRSKDLFKQIAGGNEAQAWCFVHVPTRLLHDSKLTLTEADSSIDVGVLSEVSCYVPPFCGDRFWTEERFLMISKLTVY
jgi:hypothetical protein